MGFGSIGGGGSVSLTNFLRKKTETSIEVTPTGYLAIGANIIYTIGLTIPNTYELYEITDIAWRNGATVNGNVFAGLCETHSMIEGSQSSNNLLILEHTGIVAQAGANSEQRAKLKQSRIVKGDDQILAFLQTSSATATFGVLTGGTAPRYKIASSFPIPLFDTQSWGSGDVYRIGLKLYLTPIEAIP